MGKDKVKIVVICEDQQHGALIRRFLERRGFIKANIRIKFSPSGSGSAEQWVLEQYIIEVDEYRNGHVAHKVVAMTDGDGNSHTRRMAKFDERCKRQADEKIAIFVPCRNIETWIAYLRGETVDENREYSKEGRPRNCRDAVVALIEMCDKGELASQVPPSLEAACDEYKSRFI